MRLIRFQLWVVSNPYFRSVFTNSRNKRIPARFADRLRFFNPDPINAFKRFDLGDIIAQPGKYEFGAIAPPNHAVLYLIKRSQPGCLDLRLQQVMHRFNDRVLELSRAEDAQWSGSRLYQQCPGHTPAFCTATAAV